MQHGTFASHQRSAYMRAMEQAELDLLIVGGGITGAGIALDAQTRGLQAALIDMQDFAAGTSSRSTKLIHGGLRYLKQFEAGLVAEVGRERAVVFENGPHVTVPLRMLLPIYKGGVHGRRMTSLALYVYDRLAGVSKHERRRMLSKAETLAKLPHLKRDGLLGAGDYAEYRTDDARLTLEVLKQAVRHGAIAVNYVKAESFICRDRRIIGVNAADQLTGNSYALHAKIVVNAAGPWTDALREMDRSKHGKTLRLTKGVHLVFDGGRFPLNHAVYFDTAGGRMVFAIPRQGKTYVGTTDTDFAGDPACPRMTGQDRDYLLAAVNRQFPDLQLAPEDVESSWAGLRSLIQQEGKHPSELSRKDEIFHSQSGLMTIAGGKLTGYRRMAETVVDLAAKELMKAGAAGFRPCQTKFMPISGGDVGGSAGFERFVEQKALVGERLGLTRDDAERLARKYGSNADRLFARLDEVREEAVQAQLPLPLLLELDYAIDWECCAKPADFFVRRTGDLLFDRSAVLRWKESVTAYMAGRLNWSNEQTEAYACELDRELEAAIRPV